MDMPASGAVETNAQDEAARSADNTPKIVADIARISSSIARLSSTSIEGLEGLTSELQELQKFLKTEVERIQAEIDSALAGIKIIVETIAPFKASNISQSSATSARFGRPGITTWPKT
jgi:hypothetical protein